MQLNDNELSGLRPLETWQAGEELFDRLERDYETYDYNFRHFVEECDQLQGLQIFTAADDAWGGFASKYADRLRDDFEKSSIWIWATENSLKVGGGWMRHAHYEFTAKILSFRSAKQDFHGSILLDRYLFFLIMLQCISL